MLGLRRFTSGGTRHSLQRLGSGQALSLRNARQRGVTLLGMLFAVSIATAMLTTYFNLERRKIEREDAEAAGVMLAQTADALRRLITVAPATPGVIPAGTMNGVNWLKAPTCGGNAANIAQGFVPCSFGDQFWAPNFRTTFANVGGRIEARLTFVVPNSFDANRRGNVADFIADKANTMLSASPVNAPAPGVVTPGFVTVMSNVTAAANDLSGRPAIINNPASADFGRIVMVVSNDPNTDAFLRTDGTNQMYANLNLGGNDLINGRDLQAQTATLQNRVTANRVNLRAGSTGAVLGGACATNGEVVADAQGLLLACQGGRWYPAGTQVVANMGQACSRPGSYGELASDGTGMICQNGVWIPLQARIGGIVSMASYLVSNGSTVVKPACSSVGATPRIYLYPRSWTPNVINASFSGGPPPVLNISPDNTPWVFRANDNGSSWGIVIQSSGNRPAEAIAMTACVFS